MKYILLFPISTLLISAGVFAQSPPRIRPRPQPRPTAKNACAEALDLLYRLGTVGSYQKPTAANLSLIISWPEGDPEARKVPRQALNVRGACERIRAVNIDMTRTDSRKAPPPRRENLAPLLQLPALRKLDVSGRAFLRSDLAAIARMKKLERLSLSDTNLDDIGLRIVRKLTQIQSLHIGHTKIRGTGLIHLLGLKRLMDLSIPRSNIGDGAMRHVGKLRALRKLDISYTNIGNRGAVHLAKLRRLRELDISRTRIKGKGMRHLARLRELSRIFMFGTPIGHLGFKYLARLRSLKTIFLNGDQITDRTLRTLSRSRNWKRLDMWHNSWSKFGHKSGHVSYWIKRFWKQDGTNTLNLRPTRTTGKALRYSRGINLAYLELSQQMTDYDVRLTARWFKKLERLTLGKRNTRRALWHVVHMPRLKFLNLACSSVVPRDLIMVHRKRPKLRYTRGCFHGRERFAWEPIERGK